MFWPFLFFDAENIFRAVLEKSEQNLQNFVKPNFELGYFYKILLSVTFFHFKGFGHFQKW